MTFKTSKRSDIESFRALETLRAVNERVAKGEDIIRLEAGQPCFGAPEAALDYGRMVMGKDPIQGYTEAIGMSLLRDRIAVYYRDHYNVDIDHRHVAVTVGSSGGFILAFTAAFEAGDKVGVINPTYPAYRNILKSLNIECVEINATPETNYQPTLEMLQPYAEKLDGLIINSPSNPTGTILNETELEKIALWCEENGIRLFSDEAYQRITYDGTIAQTALKFSKNAIITNTFSKYFAMTGWRLGWLVMPENIAARVKKLSENLFVSPPTISQHIAYKVFDHTNVLDGYVKKYKQNRDILKKELPKAGLDKLSSAEAAFYIYADISKFTDNSEEFCHRMIEEAGVACTAGLDFDTGRGHQTMRMSYAGSAKDMVEAVKRLQKWLR